MRITLATTILILSQVTPLQDATIQGDTPAWGIQKKLNSGAYRKPNLDPDSVMRAIAPEYGIAPVYLLGLADVENADRNPHAINKNKDSSDHGILQINNKTAKAYGVNVHELRDVKTNVELAATILANCRTIPAVRNAADEWEGWRIAYACYNAGPKRYRFGFKHADKVIERVKQRMTRGV